MYSLSKKTLIDIVCSYIVQYDLFFSIEDTSNNSIIIIYRDTMVTC
jgi:hypothetical protein